MLALPKRAAKHGVHEPGGARLSSRPHQIDGIVHDCRRRHPVEVQELIEAHPQDDDDLVIDWSDIPQEIFYRRNPNCSLLLNVGKARSVGFDLEASYRPIDRLTLSAAKCETGWGGDASFRSLTPPRRFASTHEGGNR